MSGCEHSGEIQNVATNEVVIICQRIHNWKFDEFYKHIEVEDDYTCKYYKNRNEVTIEAIRGAYSAAMARRGGLNHYHPML
jgi:hypothetical protein